MFKRVLVEEWALCIPVIAFFIFFSVFLVMSVRAMCLGRKDRDHLASLPLDETTDPTPHP